MPKFIMANTVKSEDGCLLFSSFRGETPKIARKKKYTKIILINPIPIRLPIPPPPIGETLLIDDATLLFETDDFSHGEIKKKMLPKR